MSPPALYGLVQFTATSFEWWLMHCEDQPSWKETFESREDAKLYVSVFYPNVIWQDGSKRSIGYLPDGSAFFLIEAILHAL